LGRGQVWAGPARILEGLSAGRAQGRTPAGRGSRVLLGRASGASQTGGRHMTAADSVANAVTALRRNCGLPPTPARRGPVLLDRFFEETHLSHVALPGLTRDVVASHLRADGVPVEDVGDAHEKTVEARRRLRSKLVRGQS